MADDLIRLEFDGKNYSLDIQSVTPREYRTIKQHTGLSAGAFMGSFSGDLNALDADGLVGLLWLCKQRAGEKSNISDFDDVPFLQVMAGLKLPEPEAADAPKALS